MFRTNATQHTANSVDTTTTLATDSRRRSPQTLSFLFVATATLLGGAILLLQTKYDFLQPAESQTRRTSINANTVITSDLASKHEPAADVIDSNSWKTVNSLLPEVSSRTRSNGSDSTQSRPQNINIVMMGDSLTRYQYLSLVYFLRWGEWFDPNITDVDNLVAEFSWHRHKGKNPNVRGAWNTFYWQSNRLLYPFEVCDCFRPGSRVLDSEAMPFFIENRYFRDPFLNNTVVYIQAFGHEPTLHGRVLDLEQLWKGDYINTKLQQDLLGTWTPFLWEFASWHDLVRSYVRQLRPDYLILNSGWWKSRFGNGNSTEDVQLKQAAVELLNTTSTRTFWRTTTHSSPAAPRGQKIWSSNATLIDSIMCKHFQCIDVSWTKSVPPSLYWDPAHFYEPVYRVMNEAMLEALGYFVKPELRTATAGTELNRLHELFKGTRTFFGNTKTMSKS